MNTSGLLQIKRRLKGFALTLEETRSIYDSMNRPKVEGFLAIRRNNPIPLSSVFLLIISSDIFWGLERTTH